MKRVPYIMGLVAALSLVSCTQDADVDVAKSSQSKAVQFSAESIATMTKATESSWDNGDAIGITTESTDSRATRFNIKYVTTGGTPADFGASNEAEAIYFSEKHKAMSFSAYYPYQMYWTEEVQVFDITAQNSGDLTDADLMFSDKLVDQTEGKQSFKFSHALSLLRFNITTYKGESASDITSLEDAQFTIKGACTQYNILDGSFFAPEDILMHTTASEDGQNAVAYAIMLPTAASAEVSVVVGGRSYTANLDVESFKAGMQHTYNVVLGEPEVNIVLSSVGITAWDASNGSSTVTELFEDVDGVYTISSTMDMKIFMWMLTSGNDFNGKTIKLAQDISMSGLDWSATYENCKEFRGTFDGCGYEISDFVISRDNSSLIPKNSGIIQNITLRSGNMINVEGAPITYNNNGVIRNCHNRGLVIDNSQDSPAASAIAYVNNNTIINCSNTVDLKANAGLVVNNYKLIAYCYNVGDIQTGDASMKNTSGGIAVVNADEDSLIKGCYSATKGNSREFGALVHSNFGNIEDSYYNNEIWSGEAIYDKVSGSTASYEAVSNTQMQEELYRWLNFNTYLYNADKEPSTKSAVWLKGESGYPQIGKDYRTDVKMDDILAVSDGYCQLSSDENLSIYLYAYRNGMEAPKIQLAKDFDLGCSNENQWIPLGSKDKPYSGEFDGAGFTISGLFIDQKTECQSLFGYTNGAKITNLKVSGSVSGLKKAALFVGEAHNTQFENCETLSGSTVNNSNSMSAGLAGMIKTCSFVNCTNGADVNGTTISGGIAGYCYDGEGASLSGCVNNGTISTSSSYCAGGIIGMMIRLTDDQYSISNCTNNGEIKSKTNNAGGIAGTIYGATISDCVNNAAVSSAMRSGGIVGFHDTAYAIRYIAASTINRCLNRGKIYTGKDGYAGGITATLESNNSSKPSYIINCANKGEVESAGEHVGGITGYNNGGKIFNSFSITTSGASIKGSDYVGALVGYNNERSSGGVSVTPYIANCYVWGAKAEDYSIPQVMANSSSDYVGIVLGGNNDGLFYGLRTPQNSLGNAPTIGGRDYSKCTVDEYKENGIEQLTTDLKNFVFDASYFPAEAKAEEWVMGEAGHDFAGYPSFEFINNL